MIVLDCESRASALASLSAVYRADAEALRTFLLGIDLEGHCECTRPPHDNDTELQHLVEAEFGIAAHIDRTCWFHLTRARRQSDFSEGILPLSAARERVWQTVVEVFRGTEHEIPLSKLRQDGVQDFQYVLKSGKAIHAGPYAMLVREVAFHARRNGNHDYLELPETMEDICNGYQTAHGESLHNTLKMALVPIIVKFWSEYEYGLRTALYYVYRTTQDESETWIPNTCYDGENRGIPSKRILGVEQVGTVTPLS